MTNLTTREFFNSFSDRAINCMLYEAYIMTGEDFYGDFIWYTWEDMENEFAFTVPTMIDLILGTLSEKNYDDLFEFWDDLKYCEGGRILDEGICLCTLQESIMDLQSRDLQTRNNHPVIPTLLKLFDDIEFSEELIEKINKSCNSDSPFCSSFLYDFFKKNANYDIITSI